MIFEFPEHGYNSVQDLDEGHLQQKELKTLAERLLIYLRRLDKKLYLREPLTLLLICREFAVLEVEREDEFSPLKNAPGAGSSCPETARQDLINSHFRWITNAGGEFFSPDGSVYKAEQR